MAHRQVDPAPDSWSVVWEARLAAGKITVYDSPIYIADAALYLMATQPDLGIKNPYALDEEQFTAAVDLLKQQRRSSASTGPTPRSRWPPSRAATAPSARRGSTRRTSSGGEGAVPVEAMLPKEGSTGWSDTWMISSQAKNPNCTYLWMDHIICPEANAKVTEYFGEAPVSTGRPATSPRTRTTARRSTQRTRTTSSRSVLDDAGGRLR